MVRVTKTEPHERRASYKFFADARRATDPIFVRRTAARLPPQLRPGSPTMARARERFSEANRLWSQFDASQRAFYRRIALWITSDPRGREPVTKLLSGQELFTALFMLFKAALFALGLIPSRYNPFGGDLCGNPLQGLELSIYSLTLKRTVGRWTADGEGFFQWISLPEWAAPYRVTVIHPDLGEISTEYDTLEDLMSLEPYPILHPVSMYTQQTHRWTYAQDPTWCKKHCEDGLYNQYDFEDQHEEGPPGAWNWQDSQLQVLPTATPHRYLVRWKAWMHAYHNTLYWKDKIIFVPGFTWRLTWSTWKAIDGRTGLPWED